MVMGSMNRSNISEHLKRSSIAYRGSTRWREEHEVPLSSLTHSLKREVTVISPKGEERQEIATVAQTQI